MYPNKYAKINPLKYPLRPHKNPPIIAIIVAPPRGQESPLIKSLLCVATAPVGARIKFPICIVYAGALVSFPIKSLLCVAKAPIVGANIYPIISPINPLNIDITGPPGA